MPRISQKSGAGLERLFRHDAPQVAKLGKRQVVALDTRSVEFAHKARGLEALHVRLDSQGAALLARLRPESPRPLHARSRPLDAGGR